MTQTLFEHKEHGGAQLLGQPTQGLVQPGRLARAGIGLSPHQFVELDIAAFTSMPGSLSAQSIARGVDHHGVEPSGEPALRAIGRQLGGKSDADVLCQIRGLLRVAEHAGPRPDR